MRIITKQSFIDTALKRWKEAFYRKPDYVFTFADGRTNIQVYEELLANQPLDEQKIISIIGNNSICQNICDECYNDFDVVVEVGEPSNGYDSATARICFDCIEKAKDLFLKTKKPCEIVLLESTNYHHNFIGQAIKPMADKKIGQLDYFHTKHTFDPNYWKACHLYIISDHPIEDNDWVLCNKTGEWKLFQVTCVADEIKDGTLEYMRKIVSSTNNMLTYEWFRKGDSDVICNHVIPILSNQFIKKYCENPVKTATIEFKKSLKGDRDSIVSIDI